LPADGRGDLALDAAVVGLDVLVGPGDAQFELPVGRSGERATRFVGVEGHVEQGVVARTEATLQVVGIEAELVSPAWAPLVGGARIVQRPRGADLESLALLELDAGRLPGAGLDVEGLRVGMG
jgi:hypothetical protein